MTTLKKLTAQTKRLLSSGPRPKDSKLSDRYIHELIRQATHKLLRLEHFNTMNDGQRDVQPLMIATYSQLEVQNDTAKNRNYIELPSYAMNLPGGVGVQQVRPDTGKIAEDVAMIPILPNEMELFRSLLVGAEVLKDQFCFEVDRNRIWFTERNEETLLDAGIEEVELKQCVIDPAQVDENDFWPVPPEMEYDILKEVLILHGYNPAQAADMVNDGNPNTK